MDFVLYLLDKNERTLKRRSHLRFLIFNFADFVHYCGLVNQSPKYYLLDEITVLNQKLSRFLSDIISGAKTSHPNQDELLKDNRGQ